MVLPLVAVEKPIVKRLGPHTHIHTHTHNHNCTARRVGAEGLKSKRICRLTDRVVVGAVET
jgi:hypothetical protein